MPELMDFECMLCAKFFTGVWYDIGKRRQRVIFNGLQALDEIGVLSAEGIGTFCSSECHQAGRSEVVGEELPIPPVPPGIGPMETCAECHGLVDMIDWHLMFTEGLMEETGSGIATVSESQVAAVCKKCSSSGLTLTNSADLANVSPS